MSEPENDTTTDGRTDHDYLRNEPSGTFDAHLFDREAVADAGGETDEQTNRPVSSICSRTTAYGPFYEVSVADVTDGLPDHDGDVCGVCARHAAEDEQGDDPDADDTEGEV
jgi:hypothetical protein